MEGGENKKSVIRIVSLKRALAQSARQPSHFQTPRSLKSPRMKECGFTYGDKLKRREEKRRTIWILT